ncbi:hypothetical protein IO90_05940 [Chryseobacterium sp. FH1]|nr:hypothetical protein IO90_05940 [Chryseobacterium sp. FH1]
MNKIILIIFTFFLNFYFSQQSVYNQMEKLQGIWEGRDGNDIIKFEINKSGKNDFLFSFINFQGEKFLINKEKISENNQKELIIEIKEAKFSSYRYEKCLFTKGEIIISNSSENQFSLSLNSVGPKCFLTYDVIMTMDDIKDILMTKK